MSNPKISVIIPVYNAEATLRRCVDSVLSQTFTDFECLLIDDGSKDRSGDICDEYAAKDSRVRVFHKENGGMCSVRNVGLDLSIGEWVTFCDADDIIPRSAFEQLCLDISPDVNLIVGGFQGMHSGRVSLPEKLTYLWPDLSVIEDAIVKPYFITAWCKLYLRKIACRLRFDNNFISSEDLLFNLQYVLFVKGVKFVDKVVYLYSDDSEASKYHIDCSRYLYQITALTQTLDLCRKRFHTDFKEVEHYVLAYHSARLLYNFLYITSYSTFKKEVNESNNLEIFLDSQKKRAFYWICCNMPVIAYCGIRLISLFR